MSQIKKTCLVVFAKEPIAGEVKTRLISALGAEGAKAIHLQLMNSLFSKLDEFSLCQKQLWVNQNPESTLFAQFKGEHHIQVGSNLGQKMFNATKAVLRSYDAVVIIGSDCPLMDEEYITKAFKVLEDHDVVLGPANDGGYVLIGLNQATESVFQEIAWGTENVLQQTRDRLSSHNLTWQELALLDDIDLPEDLKLL